MKRLLEQLTMLRGGACAIEEAMPGLADDCDETDAQYARDLIITTRRHLNAIEEELGLPEPLPMRVMEPDYVPLGDDDSGLSGSWTSVDRDMRPEWIGGGP